MRKLKKLASSFCSILLAASIMLGSAAPVFATDSVLPEESSSQITQDETLATPESTVPADSSSIPADSSSAPPDSESTPSPSDSNSVPTEPDSTSDSSSTPADSSSTPADSSVPVESEPTEEEAPEEKPLFEPLAIATFTPQAEFLEDRQAKLAVTLNRDDVAVRYQWQVKKPADGRTLRMRTGRRSPSAV